MVNGSDTSVTTWSALRTAFPIRVEHSDALRRGLPAHRSTAGLPTTAALQCGKPVSATGRDFKHPMRSELLRAQGKSAALDDVRQGW